MDLTKYGIFAPGKLPVFFNNQGEAGQALAASMVPLAQPSMVNVTDTIPMPGETPIDPVAQEVPQTPAMLPILRKPSFQEASTDQAGMPTAKTPGLTRMGKLLQVLGLAAQGGLAGRAASEQAVLQSGGHRGGGFGTGFQAGMYQPLQMAQARQQVEAGQLENQQRRANIAMLPWMQQYRQAQLTGMTAEAKWRQAQAEAYTALANQREAGPEDKINVLAGIAQKYGYAPDSDEFKQIVFGIKPDAERAPAAPHTVEVGNQVKQYNPKTGLYDIVVGPRPPSRDAAANKPTADEFKYKLYQDNPDAYEAIYGSRNDREYKSNLLRYRDQLVREVDTGMLSEEETATKRGMISSIDEELKGAITRPGGAKGKQLDATTAKSILDEAGGDKNKARELARKRGYKF